jgi:hypothetical protein
MCGCARCANYLRDNHGPGDRSYWRWFVPAAMVSATALETNAVTKAVANGSGVYTLAQLKEGEYALRVTAPGFKEFVANGLVLATRDIRRVDVTLEIGALAEKVEVSAGAALI